MDSMGASQSDASYAGVINEDLRRVAGRQAFPFDDSIWARVIACDITVPRKNLRETLEQAAAAWAGDLAANCETGNFAQLLRHLIQLLARCTSGDHARVPEEDVTGALNVVLLVRVAAKNHVEQLPEDRLGHLYGAFKPAWERQGDSGDVLLDAVCDALCLLLMSESHQPHTYFTYALQAECTKLATVLCATQLAHPVGMRPHLFLDLLMSRRGQARAFLGALVRQLLEREPAPTPPTVAKGFGASLGLRSSLTLRPWCLALEAAEAGAPGAPGSSLLADSCSLLLLVLLNYAGPVRKPASTDGVRRDDSANEASGAQSLDAGAPLDTGVNGRETVQSTNPFVEELTGMQDSDRPLTLDTQIQASALSDGDGQTLLVSFSGLHDAFAAMLCDDRAVLLLYNFVYMNHRFRNYLLAKSEPEALLVPVLKLMYEAGTRGNSENYMLLIILLILTHDSIYASNIHSPDSTLQSVPWFKDRMLTSITLGSLAVALLVRTFQANLRRNDAFLGANCLAVIVNMAPHFNQLHPYAAQKLIFLFEILSKRHETLARESAEISAMAECKETAHDGMASLVRTEVSDSRDIATHRGLEEPESASASARTDGCWSATQCESASRCTGKERLHACESLLRTALEAMNAALTYALPRNPHLIYSLIHKRHSFQSFASYEEFRELVGNIDAVSNFFAKKVESGLGASEHSSVDKVVQIIKEACLVWGGHLRMQPLLRFTYHQDALPENFFTPYTWSQVLLHGGVAWNPQCLLLLESTKHTVS